MRTRALLLLLITSATTATIGVLSFGLQPAKPAYAVGTTFTVNSTGDEADKSPGDGVCQITTANQCTLRAAIEEANALGGADTIAFNIPGSGVQTISPGSRGLPPITDRVTIDGYTQPGSSPNTNAQGAINASPLIELDGATSSGSAIGLQLNGPGASNSVIRGLVINNDFFFGIWLFGGTGYKVEGNFIGTDPTGTSAGPGNNDGVTMYSGNATLGGTTPDKRNIISGNVSHGIQLGGDGGNKIEGNLIGTKADGTSPLGNGVSSGGDGLLVGSPSNTIGDSDPSDGETNAANTIAFNTLNGIGISGDSGTGNRILSNSIYSNAKLGINLHGGDETTIGSGVTANDDKDPDTGPNRLQNYPVITSASTTLVPGPRFVTSISGTLNSTPSTRHKKRTFIIQFFSSPQADPSGYGEGKTFLGQTQVRTNRQGNASFSFSPTQGVSFDGQTVVAATATNKKTGDTSEFSNAKVVEGPPFIGP